MRNIPIGNTVRSRLWLLLVAAVGVIAWAAIASPSRMMAQETTSLVAQVVNGTSGGEGVTGLTLTLQLFNGPDEVSRWETVAANDGTVRFEGLETTVGLVYLISAAYKDVRYFSDPFFLSSPLETTPLLTVYETTESSEVMRIVADNTVILGPDGDSGTMQVMQIITFENTSDRTFVGDDQSNTQLTVQVSLPPLAFDMESLDSPGSLVLAPDAARRVFSILPFLPGTEELIIAYKVLYTTTDYIWSKNYPYPIDLIRLLVPEGMELRVGDEWTQLTPTDVSGTVYDHYQTSGGGAGLLVVATIRGLPTSAGTRSRDLEGTLRFVAAGLGVLAIVGAGGYTVYWSTRRRRRALTASASERTNARDEALERLVWLDEEFEAGRMEETEYSIQRDEQLRAFRQLMEREEV